MFFFGAPGRERSALTGAVPVVVVIRLDEPQIQSRLLPTEAPQMAHLQSTQRSQIFSGVSVSENVSFANRMFYRSTDPDKFVTLFYSMPDWLKIGYIAAVPVTSHRC